MSFDSITAVLDGLDLAKLVPDLTTFLGKLQLAATLAVMIGPLLLLAMGIWYLIAPPKEANHKVGFRTYYGMGSVAAWQFTQRAAGFAWGGLGAVLTLIMGIICITFGSKDAFSVVHTAVTCLIWQAILAVLSWAAVCILAVVTFDKNGERRK